MHSIIVVLIVTCKQ